MFEAVCTYAVMVTLFLGLQHVTVRMLARQRDDERARADEATNRLLAAWKDGYAIPEPDLPPAPDEDPLPPALAEWLTQWEGADAQSKWEAELRRQLAKGRTPDQILMDMELAS
jgi:hypothetical protein